MTSKSSVREELENMRADLQQAADQVRLRLHLAGMDAKDAWAKMEPRLHDFEHKAEAVTEEAGSDLRQVGRALKKELDKLKERLS